MFISVSANSASTPAGDAVLCPAGGAAAGDARQPRRELDAAPLTAAVFIEQRVGIRRIIEIVQAVMHARGEDTSLSVHCNFFVKITKAIYIPRIILWAKFFGELAHRIPQLFFSASNLVMSGSLSGVGAFRLPHLSDFFFTPSNVTVPSIFPLIRALFNPASKSRCNLSCVVGETQTVKAFRYDGARHHRSAAEPPDAHVDRRHGLALSSRSPRSMPGSARWRYAAAAMVRMLGVQAAAKAP